MGAEAANRSNILLVEDEPVIRELVSSMLSDGEVDVVCAGDGVEGLKLAELARLPAHPDGRGAAADGRHHRVPNAEERPAHGRVPLYMLTAKAKKADVEIATRAGADGYIHKPFRGAELMDLVARLRSGSAKPQS